jgi:diguanylate cyclase (GGDEF)-like protein
MAERIRREVEALEFAPHGPSLRVTVSLGVGTSAAPQPFPALMRIADQALYEAKRLGRNRVQVRGLEA